MKSAHRSVPLRLRSEGLWLVKPPRVTSSDRRTATLVSVFTDAADRDAVGNVGNVGSRHSDRSDACDA